jgi:hypothetical protein
MDCQALHDILGLQFMPVRSNKQPIVKGWQTAPEKHSLTNCEGVGLVCGKLSGGLEVIDVDCKYDLTGKLFENYKRLIHSVDSGLLKKLVIEKTVSGGYHVIYRCSVIGGNAKLANRPTTEQEKQQTYDDTYQSELSNSKTDTEAKAKAEKAKINDKVRVLLETRGEGGYIMCFPSIGYELTYGDYYSITEITPEERDILHGIARQFNSYVEEYAPAKTALPRARVSGLSPFDDYNQRGDVVALLEEHGWKAVGQKGVKTMLLRPGQTTSQTSGNYDSDKNWFSVFTTSSEFDPERAYLPYAVFAILECKKDFSEASKRLYELGYGDRNEPKEKAPSTRIIQPTRVKADDNDYSFLATSEDYDPYLTQVIDGTLVMGLTTGSPTLDRHFVFKEGNLVMTNGHDNTGKSVWVWWLLMLAAMYHGWKFMIFSSENTIGSFMRKMIQFYWGKQLRGQYAMTPAEYNEARDFVVKHFFLIKAQEDLFNYKDIINMARKVKAKYPDIKGGMIDPYNSLKTDLSGFSKLSTHDYHYEALSELKAFGQVNKFGWFVNHHAVTESLRKLDKDGYPCAPQKADTEGGGKVANKADEFMTIHRKTQHPTEWMLTEVHVRKVKDTETGGMQTPLNNPLLYEMYKGQCGFREKTEMGYEVDPIMDWHKRNGRIILPPTNSFNHYKTPYKEDYDDVPDITF